MSVAYRFFLVGILFALAGTCLGTFMGASHDFTLAAVHAHINLVGWATQFLFGLYYRIEADNARGALPEAHFWTSAGGALLLVFGIFAAVTGRAELAPIGFVPGAIMTVAGLVLFLIVVIRGWARQSARKDGPLLTA